MGLGKTLAELEGVPFDELIGWMAFYDFEPWGCAVEDQRTEAQLSLLYGIHSKRGSRIPTFFDRDPQSRIKPEPTTEELDDNIRDFFLGKTVKVVE